MNNATTRELIDDKEKYNIKLYIGGFQVSFLRMFAARPVFNDALLFYTGFNTGNICKKNVIFVSPSPDQYISSTINYLIYQLNIDTAFIYDGSDSDMLNYNSIVIDSIKSTESLSDYEIIIDISNYTSKEAGIQDFINKIISGRKRGYIITTLKGLDLQYLFVQYRLLTSYQNEDFTPIFCFSADFFQIQYQYTYGHYFVSDTIPYYPASLPFLNKINQILGVNYIYIGTEFNYLLSLSLISKSLKHTKDFRIEDILQYLYRNEIETEIGRVQLTFDNVVSHSIVLLKMGASGIEPISFVSVVIQEARVWYDKYFQQTVYSCNWRDSGSEKYPRLTLPIGIVLSFTGDYSYQDLPLLHSYSLMIRLINENQGGVRGMLILPIFKNADSKVDGLRDIIESLYDSGVKIIAGMSNSEMRIESYPYVEEKGMILIYPHNYEGCECKENIIYVGIPFTNRVYIKYIY